MNNSTFLFASIFCIVSVLTYMIVMILLRRHDKDELKKYVRKVVSDNNISILRGIKDKTWVQYMNSMQKLKDKIP